MWLPYQSEERTWEDWVFSAKRGHLKKNDSNELVIFKRELTLAA